MTKPTETIASSTPLPTSPEALFAQLKQLNIPYTLFNHPPVFTVASSHHLHQTIPGAHCKNLFLRDKKGKMCLITLADHTRPNLNALSPILGFGRLSFGSPERLFTHLGITPGSVNPFCVLNDKAQDITFFLDKALAQSSHITAHPMRNDMSINLKSSDLIRFATHHNHPPIIIDLAPFSI